MAKIKSKFMTADEAMMVLHSAAICLQQAGEAMRMQGVITGDLYYDCSSKLHQIWKLTKEQTERDADAERQTDPPL